jgi:hypothetical protein
MKTFFLILTVVATSWASIEQKRYPTLLDLIPKNFDKLIVYEGLPHPTSESGARAVEKANKKYFSVGNELFYENPLSVSEEDKVALDRMMRTPSFFRSRIVGDMSLCGEFHADYAIEWRKNDTRLAIALLCFGCRELRLISPDGATIADPTKEGFEALQKVLKKYRQERPVFIPEGPLLPPALPSPLPLPKIDPKL